MSTATEKAGGSAAARRPARRTPLHVAGAGETGAVRHHQLGGDMFAQYPASAGKAPRVTVIKTAPAPRDAEGDSEPIESESIIFSGTLTVPAVYEIRGIDDDCAPGREIETVDYQVEYTRPGGQPAATAIDDSELGATGRDAHKWARRVGLGPHMNRSGAGLVDHAVRAFAANTAGEVHPVPAYSSTGLARIDGRHVFLRSNLPALTATGTDADLIARLPAGIFRDASWAEALSYPDPSPETAGDDARALYGVLGAAPDSAVMHAMLCQLVTAPLVGVGDIKPLAAIVKAESGTGKGIVQALMVGMQSGGRFVPTAGSWDPPALSAERLTELALRSRLHHTRGYVATVIDVFQEGMSPADQVTAWKKVNMSARSAADGSRGGAMQRDGINARADKYVRGCLTFDAEELPDAAKRPGALGRAFVIAMDGDPFRVRAARAGGSVDRSELSAIYASLPAASRALAAMIGTHLGDLDRHGLAGDSLVRAALDWGRETVAGWRIDGHSRTVPKYGQMLAGAYLLGEHLGAVADLDPGTVRGELADAVRGVASAQAATMAPASRTRKAHGKNVDTFARTLRRMMEDGKSVLMASARDSQRAPDATAAPEGRSISIYGWRAVPVGMTYLGSGDGWQPAVTGAPVAAIHSAVAAVGRRPTFALAAWMWPENFARLHAMICERAARDGSSLPGDVEMRGQLTEAGYLMPPEKDTLWEVTTKRVLKLDIERILNADDESEDPTPEPEATPVPEPTPAPVPAASAGRCCSTSPVWCAAGRTWGTPLACEACGTGEPVYTSSRCGIVRHADCATPTPRAAAPIPPATVAKRPSTRPVPVERPKRAAIVGRVNRPSYALDIPRAVELANFAEIVHADDPTHWEILPTAEEIAAGLDRFHAVTDWTGLESKSAGQIGALVFSRLEKRSGSTPDAAKIALPMLDGVKPRLLDPRWVNTSRELVIGGPDVIGLDVNGQFHAAASMELGTGLPEAIERATSAAELLTVGGKWRDIPVYGTLAADLDVPSILGPLRAGDVLAGPALRYLADDLKMDVPLSSALRWEHHRRWMHLSYEFWRDARTALTGVDTPGDRLALRAVKNIVNTFIGGWMRSTTHNRGVTLRVDHCHHIITRARMNALRAARKATAEPLALVADTLYFSGMAEIGTMPIPAQRTLGTFKVEKVAPVTAEMIAAHQSGRPNRFRDAVNASNREGTK